MAVCRFCTSCDSMTLFDSGAGWKALSFDRTFAGLKAFDAKYKRRFTKMMLNSLDGCTRWYAKWACGQWPVFIEDGGKLVGVGSAYPVMSYMRYMTMDKEPPIELMWNTDISGRLNRGSGGWSCWWNRHVTELKGIRSVIEPYMHDDIEAMKFLLMEEEKIQGMASRPESRIIAAKCINLFRRNSLSGDVIGLLSDKDPSIRMAAITALDIASVSDFWTTVLKMSDDPEWRIRCVVLDHVFERLRYEDMMCHGWLYNTGNKSSEANKIFDGEFVERMQRLSDDPEFEVRMLCGVLMNRFLSDRFDFSFRNDSAYRRIVKTIASANTHDDWFMPDLAIMMVS